MPLALPDNGRKPDVTKPAMKGAPVKTDQPIPQADFIVSPHFSAKAREVLGLKRDGPPSKNPPLLDPLHLRRLQVGDFLRIEGFPHIWVVEYRTWHLMRDQTVLKLTLDGPIAESD